jgi:hypothetical protein
MSSDLLSKTLQALSDRKGQWPAICRATGLDYDWLTKLAQGRITDPGVRKIQRLHDHLCIADGTPSPREVV